MLPKKPFNHKCDLEPLIAWKIDFPSEARVEIGLAYLSDFFLNIKRIGLDRNIDRHIIFMAVSNGKRKVEKCTVIQISVVGFYRKALHTSKADQHRKM